MSYRDDKFRYEDYAARVNRVLDRMILGRDRKRFQAVPFYIVGNENLRSLRKAGTLVISGLPWNFGHPNIGVPVRLYGIMENRRRPGRNLAATF